MARQWRIEFEGALYHILSRGNQQQDIFLGDEDRGGFLDALGEMSDRFAVDIFAYVLMDIIIFCLELKIRIFPKACSGWEQRIPAVSI